NSLAAHERLPAESEPEPGNQAWPYAIRYTAKVAASLQLVETEIMHGNNNTSPAQSENIGSSNLQVLSIRKAIFGIAFGSFFGVALLLLLVYLA
ncbi:hypothetical protein ACJX0J_024616, partial [Zea mays]